MGTWFPFVILVMGKFGTEESEEGFGRRTGVKVV